ncbi:MAG: Do family serine endopeptidase [SAR86 cluster bacterium]|uniref:Do family serine endopeptidase n=1 Tax=SAR86 cluster bacterium TaxID=2030880 RepID=A0A520MUW4_9GAMM|nr:MAG: Do family serine endopeptidase [SAR86 cluster bacterium]
MKKFIAIILVFLFSLDAHEFDFSELVKNQSESVVNIQSIRKIKYNRRSLGGFPEELFREFGIPMPEMNDPRGKERESISTGSGFVIDKNGYVITNFHVVQGADEVLVKFLDRREFKAEIVGMDELSDLALLKIDSDDFDPVEIGNSDEVEQGDGVIAIGSPYNYDFSVTFGIISATGRGITSGQGIGDYVPYLQTDAAVNRGNSGGPLFNTEGEVIGINSQIFSRSGGNEGLAFAIPINIALEVVEQLKDNGKFSRGYLGVQGGEVSSDLAEALGMEKPIGALVRAVVKDGAAEKGGIKPGDVIVKVGKKDVIYFKDLQHSVGMTKPKTNLKIKLFRDGEYTNLYVKVGELPSQERPDPVNNEPDVPNFPLGLELENTDNEEFTGVRVVQVTRDSPAVGQILSGDIITKIKSGNTTYDISKVEDFKNALDSFAVGDKIAVFGTREGSNFFVAVTVE